MLLFSEMFFIRAFRPVVVTRLKDKSKRSSAIDVRTTAQSCAPRSWILLLSSARSRKVGDPHTAFIRHSTPVQLI